MVFNGNQIYGYNNIVRQKPMVGQELKSYKTTKVTLDIEEKPFQDCRRQANMASPFDLVCGHPCKERVSIKV